jgi:paraquat-inducible protein B
LHPGTFGGAEVDERLPLTAEQFQLRLEEFKDEILQQRRDFLVDSLGTNFQKLTKKRRTLKRDLKGGISLI